MPSELPRQQDRADLRLVVAIAGGLCVAGLLTAGLCWWLGMRDERIALGPYIGFLIGYGCTTMGAGLLAAALTSGRQVRRTRGHRRWNREAGVRYRTFAGSTEYKRKAFTLSITIETLWPSAVYAVAAGTLLIIAVVVMQRLPSTTVGWVGVLVAGFFGWWAVQTFRAYRRRRRNR